MSTATSNKRAARIVGGLLIASSAALAVGLRAANNVDQNQANPPQPSAAATAKNEIAQLPRLKSVPPQSYPLTLANEPAQSRAEVITAEYYEAAAGKRNHPPEKNRTPNPLHPPKIPR